MGEVVLNAMRRGVGTLGVFSSGYLLVVGTPTALGRSTCVERELLLDFAEEALIRVETW